jgi:uncharacterized protein (TIGR03083 family)
MEPLTAIYTADLFPALQAELIGLLRGLTEDDWERPTLAAPWRVRDVVAHLLDGDCRKLAGGRDRHGVSTASSFTDIVHLINEQNASGVAYAERLSPRLMTDLLEITGRWVSDYVATLDPHASARVAVAWADEDRSENWMDTGREYTERWHHQMQIREAVEAEGLITPRWFRPVLDLSVRAFRRSYREVVAPVGASVIFEVQADTGYAWSVTREAAGWSVVRGQAPAATACVRADADTAWKLLFNALPADAARARVAMSGESRLAEPMLRTRSVMV